MFRLLAKSKSQFLYKCVRYDCIHTTKVVDLENQIRDSLRYVIDPITNQSIVSLGSIKKIKVHDGNRVDVELDEFIPGYPYSMDLIDKCEYQLRKIDWIKESQVIFAKKPSVINKHNNSATGLSEVKHILAVSSCKGGVGKSTISVNLALSLARKGLKVGILDADVYGPSLPIMLPVKSNVVKRSQQNPKFILPLEGPMNMKVLSFGHVNPNAGVQGAGGKEAALLRGPVVSKIINQLINATEWGDLDYLVVDMPPGTGDIQLTTCQSMAISGAVVVTTPHSLSLVDAVKGVKMFHDMNVPTLAIVENMSYFKCDDGKLYYPFGKGGKELIVNSLNVSNSKSSSYNRWKDLPFHSFPIEQSISDDIGKLYQLQNQNQDTIDFLPFILQSPTSETSLRYLSLADDVISEVFRIQMSAVLTPAISYSKTRGVVLRYYLSDGSAREYIIPPAELRIRSPVTGKRIEGEDIKKYLQCEVLKIDTKGNYGAAFNWSDGHHADIFPYGILKEIAIDIETNRSSHY